MDTIEIKYRYKMTYSNIDYINSEITFSEDKLLTDISTTELMMDWEHNIMNEHAKVVCHNNGDVLEIGFGMGISADYIQGLTPSSHTIIEVHPQIYAKLEEWAVGKSNVTIINSDWFTIKDTLAQYDGIFYDAMGDFNYEYFAKTFVSNHIKSGGKYTYFNGSGLAENIFGLSASFVEFNVTPDPNNYFTQSLYNVPTVQY